jgi:hypothetical protein
LLFISRSALVASGLLTRSGSKLGKDIRDVTMIGKASSTTKREGRMRIEIQLLEMHGRTIISSPAGVTADARDVLNMRKVRRGSSTDKLVELEGSARGGSGILLGGVRH